jgi:hypothetical protein
MPECRLNCQYKAAVLNVLRFFEVVLDEVQLHGVEFLEKILVTTVSIDGCWYPAVELDTLVKKGHKLGEI